MAHSDPLSLSLSCLQIRYALCEGGIEWEDACAPFPAPSDVKAKYEFDSDDDDQ